MNDTCVSTECSGAQYFDHDTNTCLNCTAGCSQCYDGSSCKVCSAPAPCQSGYFLNATTCDKCAATGCSSCDSAQCDACFDGFTYNATNKNCTAKTDYNCTAGEYLNNGTCAKCDAGCDECSGSGTCLMCNNVTVATFNTYNCTNFCNAKCVDGSNGCFKCDTTSNDCLACNNDYYFNGFMRTC